MSITSIVTYDADLAYRRERAMATFARVGRRGWRVRLTAPAAPPAVRLPEPCPAGRLPATRPA